MSTRLQPDIRELLHDALTKRAAGVTPTDEERKRTAADLRTLLAVLAQKHEFVTGQLVEAKHRCQNKSADRGGVAIVSRLLPTPIMHSETDVGSCYFREPIDMVIGVLEHDGVIVEYHVDSRRYQPYTGPLPVTQ